MTLTSRTLGLTLVAALTISGSGLVSGQAQASGRAYETIVKVNTAKIKACKTPIREGRGFRVHAFLDNTASEPSDDVYLQMKVLRNGKATGEAFRSAYIKGGKSSKVYDLVTPGGKAFELDIVAAGRQYGGGATLSVTSLNRC